MANETLVPGTPVRYRDAYGVLYGYIVEEPPNPRLYRFRHNAEIRVWVQYNVLEEACFSKRANLEVVPESAVVADALAANC